ncbi:MAG: hypothetical protein ACTHK2_00850 [Dokdonella sp.]|uniref:hypothetical protein n=1 Tax=Dokdonella sp. TaxID=2291710 RepID=UPI003F7EA8A9
MNAKSFGLLALAALPSMSSAMQMDIEGPTGSVRFGASVQALPNGNFIVADPGYQSGRGAVHLLGPAGTVISTLRGASIDDHLGAGSLLVLPNGNVVACNPTTSRNASGAPIRNAGSATWIDGRSGLEGTVSEQNSLIGSSENDEVGGDCRQLRGGNYVVLSPNWDSASATNAGAVTWGSGERGVSGTISAANSVIGSSDADFVGLQFVELDNGNGVIPAEYWDVGGVEQVGAAIWLDGEHGTVGEVGGANALIGSSAFDHVGSQVVPLAGGSYYVFSDSWHASADAAVGAMTWCSGSAPCAGPVSASNSLVGASPNDMASSQGIALANGKMLAMMPNWSSAAEGLDGAGAVTVLRADRSVVGPVAQASLLHGAAASDHFGKFAVALDNGNAVAWSNETHINGEANGVGVSFVDSDHPATGPVLLERTLSSRTGGVGSSVRVVPLAGGRYAVACPDCSVDGIPKAGAVVWSDVAGVTGWIDGINSVHGRSPNDRVGDDVIALSNGNYVIVSPSWGGSVIAPEMGAATWVDGATGFARGATTLGVPVAVGNSLVGNAVGDHVGSGGVIALANGNYAVGSPSWDNANISDAGAVTWADGAEGASGVVSAANSLFGTLPDDRIGNLGPYRCIVLGDGSLVVASPEWDEPTPTGSVQNVGALTLMDGRTGLHGPITADNSLLGRAPDDFLGYAIYGQRTGAFAAWSPYVHYCDPQGHCGGSIGAVTPFAGNEFTPGRVSLDNSVFGHVENQGTTLSAALGGMSPVLLVGQPEANIVSLLTFGGTIFRNGFEAR